MKASTIDDCLSAGALEQLPMLFLELINEDVGPTLVSRINQLQIPVHIDDDDQLLGHRESDLPNMKTYLQLQYLFTVAQLDAVQSGLALMEAQRCAAAYLHNYTTTTIQRTQDTDIFHFILRSSSHFITSGERPLAELRALTFADNLPWCAAPWSTNKDLRGEGRPSVSEASVAELRASTAATLATAPAQRPTPATSFKTFEQTIKKRQDSIKRFLYCLHDGSPELLPEGYQTLLPAANIQPTLLEIRSKFPYSFPRF